MTSRDRRSRRALRGSVSLWTTGTVTSLALLAVGLAYLDHPTNDPESLPPPAARLLAPKAAASCPLPVGQQIKAVKAFRDMMPVFRHPRCSNCHGGLNPLSEKHPGVDQLDPELDPAAGPMMPDVREKFVAQCQDCHDGLPGWTIPHQSVFFVDKDDEELCLQMKKFEPTAEGFVSHIHDDHGLIQFIAAGFAGDRALGEGLKDYGLVVEKPPGTQAELTNKARAWVAAMGGKYVGSAECGCVMPRIKLEVHHTEVFDTPGGLPSKEESEARFEVKLEPVGDGRSNMFAGEHSLDRESRMTLPKACTGKSVRRERWTLRATIDPKTGNITVSRNAMADQSVGGIQCRQGGGTAKLGLFPNAAVAMLGYGDLVLPPDSGSSKTVTAKQLAARESLTITVLEVPAR